MRFWTRIFAATWLSVLSISLLLMFAPVCVQGCSHTPDLSKLGRSAATDPAESGVTTPFGTTGLAGNPDGTEGPNRAATWLQGKREAEADFRHTVKSVTWWIVAALAGVGVLMLIASFFVAWASVKVSAYCLAAIVATTVARYILLTYGTLTADVLFWCAVATALIVCVCVGIPLVHAWVKRGIWQRGLELAEAGKPREATVALASASDEIDAARKQVSEHIEEAFAHGGPSALKSLFRLLSRGEVPAHTRFPDLPPIALKDLRYMAEPPATAQTAPLPPQGPVA